MTKIANKKPVTISRPVYVTNDQYEIWYSKPVSLGHIDKKGDYWYTQDGMRFVSSRNAMTYLIKMYEVGSPVASGTPRTVQAEEVAREVESPLEVAKPAHRSRPAATRHKTGHSSIVVPTVPEDDEDLLATIAGLVEKHRQRQRKKQQSKKPTH